MAAGIAGSVLVILVVVATAGVMYVNDVEQPKYDDVRSEGAIEVRDYPKLVVAEVLRLGARREAASAGFRPLANYIFAKERAGDTVAMTAPVTRFQDQPIAMTAPVTQQRTHDANAAAAGKAPWTVRFIMPSRYALDDLPRPAGSDVKLRAIDPRRVAVISFSGVATDQLLESKEGELRAWLAAQNLTPRGAPTYAYYNAPWTPGFMRRNELMFELPSQERS